MLKNYLIEKELGKGTYGVVYKAKNRLDNNICVIKKLSLLGLTANQKKEVKLEADILKKIKSKYVVQYYDSFEEDNNLYIVMEYCECGDLNDFIEKQKKTKYLLKEDEVWKFFIKITLGLADIHKLKILHRDLKTLNIFLKQDNDVRVGDLGVAKVLNQTFFAKTFIGTPYYLSPEICEDKPYNDKSDIWALGCILYDLCTYKKPFTAKSQGGLILKILNEDPKPIDTYYSKELRDLVTEIFNKDYQKRPSCEDILTNKFVIEKAKKLGIFEDIKNSISIFEDPADNNKLKVDKSNNKIKINIPHNKPIIVKNNKNINFNNIYFNNKRPSSNHNYVKQNCNLKINKIKISEKKKTPNVGKNQNLGILNVPNNKEKKDIKKIKLLPNKDRYNDKIGKYQVRKKVIVQPNKDILLNKKDKKDALMKAEEKLEKKGFFNQLLNNNNKDKKPIINDEKKNNLNNNNWINTKDLNNIISNENSITKEQSNIDNNIEKGTLNPKMNYSIDSKMNENENKENNINKFDLEKTKEKKDNNEDNNNFSIESDIYMTAKKDIYQPNNIKKEENNEPNIENTKKEFDINKLGIEDSLAPMKTQDFQNLLSDFDPKKDTTLVDFKIINNEENNEKTENIVKNIDNNESISSEEEENQNKCLSDNDKLSDDSGNGEDEEKCYEIGANNKEEEIDSNNKEEEKTNLKNDLDKLKDKINILKENISKLIGEEKYNYIMEILSVGIKDNNKQEEVNDKIEKFIKENNQNINEEKLYDILHLFILECQYYKKKENYDKL